MFTPPARAMQVEAVGAVHEAVHEPLEANRNFGQSPFKRGGYTVDHRSRDKRFPDGRISSPPWPVLKQIVYGHGQ
jgi:hypothetical protein